jgi:formylglycine-generating enzyme required for sulfatase activity
MDDPFRDLLVRLDHLPDQFDGLRRVIRKAIDLADTDPEMALARVRKVLEYLVQDAHQRLVKEPPGTRPLENLLERLVKDGHLPTHLTPYTTFIRELGNAGTHRGEGKYKRVDVKVALIQLGAILDWYFETVRPDAALAASSTDPSPARDDPPRPAGSAPRVANPPRDRPDQRELINVFVSYRREDSLHQAGRLYDRLVAHFGPGRVFKDVDAIPLGADFREVLTERVAGCDVFIAVIGDTWLSIAGKRGHRRLDDPGDFVRIEIEAALSRRIPIIPVLVGHSSFPQAEELPETLQSLSFRHGLPVRPDPDFHNDMDRLIRGIEKAVSAAGARPAPRETRSPRPHESTGSRPRVGELPYRSGENRPSPLQDPERVAPPAPSPERHRPRWLLFVAAAVLALLLLGVIIYVAPDKGRIVRRGDDEHLPVENESIRKGKATAEAKKAGEAPKPGTDRDVPALPGRITNSIGMNLVLIPAGEFLMGSDETDPDARNDEVVVGAAGKKEKHLVRITRPFYLGATEVTRGQFRRFVDEASYQTEAEKDGKGGYGWNEAAGEFELDPKYTWQNAGFEQTDEHPVVNVSWNDATAFCEWLSQKDGRRYRLPTEAEWEYACRAGTTTKYSNGDDPESLAAVGNIADGTAKAKYPNWTTIATQDGFIYTAPVGRFNPNAWGLFDLHGNVWEWCRDGYAGDYYQRSPTDDPQGPDGASAPRVIRGGSWNGNAQYVRAALRGGLHPGLRSYCLGFRCGEFPSVR